jgi:mono/diheme cytochrome c family protein
MTNRRRLPRAYRHRLGLSLAAGVVCAGLAASGARAQSTAPPATVVERDHAAKMAKGLEVFKTHVRPILIQHCIKCHGGKKTESEFDLSERARLLRGGTAGPAIVVGNAKESLLYQLISHAKEPHMPHNGRKLPDEDIRQIAAWIENGAPYDNPLRARQGEAESWTRKVVPEDARQFWAFQPLRRVEPPPVQNETWPRTPIDRFILSKLEAAGVQPNPPISRRQLIRRAYFDLVGLPPTPQEIEAFGNDPAPDAYERLLEHLLDSPHYGERWGRHWLDLARFGESHGFEHDYDRPTAYPYRDFVIGALNGDLPYDRFVKWQLAGDEFAPDNNLALMATGFLAAGVHSTQITKREVEKHRYDEMDDMAATIGTAMLGLTIGCARCHDHKFDPIPQCDYYRIVSTFTTTVRSEVYLDFFEQLKNAVRRLSKPNFVKALLASEGLKPVRLHTQGDDFFKETYFLRRGDPDQKEGIAPQGFLQVLMTAPEREKHWQLAPPSGWRTSYRRRALANWITDVDQGAGHLLARVIVNRLWQHHLGRGIVATPSEFGSRGERPSHPELLDWLAMELIRHDWRLKPIHKLIMSSSVYLQSSTIDESKARADRDNRLFWRRPRLRLEAEIIRDALLAVSGEMDTKMFGLGSLDESSKRRSIYFTVKRSKLLPMMQVFDAPDALGSIGERPTTTIAPQALLLMNDPRVREYARSLARRVASDVQTAVEDSIISSYLIALGRPPNALELAEGLSFIKRQTESHQASEQGDARQLALADFCQVLMCLNEFVYVE